MARRGSLPDAPLRSYGPGIWIVEGPRVRDMGVPFTTRMVVVRLRDGALWIDDPVPVSPATLENIRALGPVRYLVGSTPRHVWRLTEWHTLCPAAEMWARQMHRRSRRLPFAGVLADEPPAAWEADIDQLVFWGSRALQEIVFLHRESRTAIVGDLVQSYGQGNRSPLRRALWRLAGMTDPRGGVPRDIRLSFTDRGLAHRALDRLLAWDFDRLIIAHGPCIDQDAKPFVQEAFRWLAPPR